MIGLIFIDWIFIYFFTVLQLCIGDDRADIYIKNCSTIIGDGRDDIYLPTVSQL